MCRGSVISHVRAQGAANFSHKGQDNKYFMLCGQCSLCCSDSTPATVSTKPAIGIGECLCSSNTSFIKKYAGLTWPDS